MKKHFRKKANTKCFDALNNLMKSILVDVYISSKIKCINVVLLNEVLLKWTVENWMRSLKLPWLKIIHSNSAEFLLHYFDGQFMVAIFCFHLFAELKRWTLLHLAIQMAECIIVNSFQINNEKISIFYSNWVVRLFYRKNHTLFA